MFHCDQQLELNRMAISSSLEKKFEHVSHLQALAVQVDPKSGISASEETEAGTALLRLVADPRRTWKVRWQGSCLRPWAESWEGS
jgi:hypothetical protein